MFGPRPRDVLRQTLARSVTTVIPSVGCALHAKIGEALSFEAVSIRASDLANHLWGLPDAEEIGFDELAEAVRKITDVIEIPLLVECDASFSTGSLATRRVIGALIDAGASAIAVGGTKSPDILGPLITAALDARDEADKDVMVFAACEADALSPDFESRVRDLKDRGLDGIRLSELRNDTSLGKARRLALPLWLDGSCLNESLAFQDVVAAGVELLTVDVVRLGTAALWDHVNLLTHEGFDSIARERPGQPSEVRSFGTFDLVGFPTVREWEERYLSAERLVKYEQSIGLYDPGRSNR
jgi:hypothetical protein